MPLFRHQDSETRPGFELELATAAVVAGTAVRGQLRGLSEPADVALVRVESCPAGRLVRPISLCLVTPHGGHGRFELVVPPETPPNFAGPRCRLDFAVRAHSPVSGRRRAQVVVRVEVSGGERRVHEASDLHDRMIASFPARHFHIELADALLEGGGHIDGRVHVRDGGSRAVDVTARCEETWRTNFRFRNPRHPPLWRTQSLWHHTTTVECQADRRWQPFAFVIPPGLPPAIEGHIVCWRYEIEVRRQARVGPAQRAVITPLRFDIA